MWGGRGRGRIGGRRGRSEEGDGDGVNPKA